MNRLVDTNAMCEGREKVCPDPEGWTRHSAGFADEGLCARIGRPAAKSKTMNIQGCAGRDHIARRVVPEVVVI